MVLRSLGVARWIARDRAAGVQRVRAHLRERLCACFLQGELGATGRIPFIESEMAVFENLSPAEAGLNVLTTTFAGSTSRRSLSSPDLLHSRNVAEGGLRADPVYRR